MTRAAPAAAAAPAARVAHPETIKVKELDATRKRFFERKISAGAGLNEAAVRVLEEVYGDGTYREAMDAGSLVAVLEARLRDAPKAAAPPARAGAAAEEAESPSATRQVCRPDEPGHASEPAAREEEALPTEPAPGVEQTAAEPPDAGGGTRTGELPAES